MKLEFKSWVYLYNDKFVIIIKIYFLLNWFGQTVILICWSGTNWTVDRVNKIEDPGLKTCINDEKSNIKQ